MVKLILYIIAWILNSLCAIGLIVSAYAYLIPPARCIYGPVVAMTFPAWAIAMAVLLVLDLIFWRKCAIQAALALLICWGPLRATCPLNIPKGNLTEAERERSFTIMTYNVSKFIDNDTAYVRGRAADPHCRHISYILDVQPDIVCIQEAESFAPYDNSISPAQLDSLHAAYPYMYLCGSEFGVLSKFPVEPVSLGEGTSYEMSCWRFDIHGRVVNIFSVHLSSLHLSDDSKVAYQGFVQMDSVSRGTLRELRRVAIPRIQHAAITRADQIDLLASFLGKYGGENAIVCGDFNDVENSYAIRCLQSKADLKQAWSSVGFGPMPTYNYYSMYFHIDHILYRGAMSPRSIRLDRVKASDHYPQIATFLLNN